MAERKLQFKIEALGTDELSQEITLLQEELVSLAARRKELARQFKEGEISQKNYSQQLADNRIKTQQLNKELRGQSKQFLETRKGAIEAANSYDALTKRNNQLRKQLRAMPDAFDPANEAANRLKKEIAENTQQLKDFDKEIGDNFRNVGNYSDAIKEAFQGTESFSGAIQNNNTIVNNYTSNVTQMVSITQQFSSVVNTAITNIFGMARGTKGAIAGLKALRVALVSTGIGAIVIALGSLVAFLTQTKKGAEALSIAMAGVEAVFTVLLGKVVSFGEAIFEAVTNPKEAIISFGDTIKNFVIDRIQAALDFVGFLGEAVSAVFEGDFEKAGEAAANAGKKFLEMNPVIAVTAAVIQEVGEAAVEMADQVVASVERATEIQKLEILYKDLNRELTVTNSLLSGQIEQQQALADDTTRSFAEREAATLRAVELQEKFAANEQRLAALQLEIATKRREEAQKNNLITDEILQNEADARQRVIEADNAALAAEQDNERTRRELKQDRLERDLDILIDGFDNQKSINERIIGDEERTVAERRRLLDETRALGEESFNQQIAIIEELTGAEINANELITESDAVALNEKIRNLGASEVIEGRILEIIRDRKTAEQDYADTTKQLNKEVAESEKKSLEERQKQQEKYAGVLAGTLEGLGDQFGSLLADTEATQGDFLKATLLTLLKGVQQTANLMIAQATAQSFAQPDSVATFGASGAIRAGALTALINAAVSFARSKIENATFAKGGLVDGGMFDGPSHANGGIKFAAGGRIMEAEGGEAIINKRSTSMFRPVLSAINAAGGGKKFAEGGIISDNRLSSINNLLTGSPSSAAITSQATSAGVDELADRLGQSFNNLKVTNVVTETESNIASIKNVQSEASI